VGAWPVALHITTAFASLGGQTIAGDSARDRVVVAWYAAHAPRIVGLVGGRYHALPPADFRRLVFAACDAGAKPAGAFSLAAGRKVLATFEVDRGMAGKAGEIVSHVTIADTFDGSHKLQVIDTATRVVCANTLAIARRQAAATMLQAAHTSSIADKVPAMEEAIGEAVRSGRALREAFAERADRALTRSEADALFDALFPPPGEKASAHAKTRAENARADARRAASMAVNDVGPTVATLQNAATWLVDRKSDGSPRMARGDADRLDSLLLGDRGSRVQEIETIVQVFMASGQIVDMPATEALDTPGIDPAIVGRAVLSDMLGGDPWS